MARRREDVKHYPMSYSEAVAMLDGKQSRKIDNNTYLENLYNCIAIRLHGTYVVKFHDDGTMELNSGGYRSVTTKSRINAVLPGWMGIGQKDYQWFISDRHAGTTVEFVDGMTLDRPL